MGKYSWHQNHEDELGYTVVLREGEIETMVAITDTEDKAYFITQACNLLHENERKEFNY
jgi:Uma2 family endonuclease